MGIDVSSYRCSLLVVDDEPALVGVLSALLAEEFEVVTASSGEQAQEVFAHRPVDLVLADQALPGLSGVQLLEWVRDHHPRTTRLLMTGLARFEDAIAAINCSQVYRYLCKPWRSEELLQVLRTAARNFLLERSHERLLDELRQLNLQLEERVLQRTRELEEANYKLQQKTWMLEKLALTDSLTGLPNRRAMDRLVKSELRRRGRYPTPLALGIVDADHFKEINSRYLLTGGDLVLIGLGKTLQRSVRSVDTVGRIGGEEFMFIAPETDRDGAWKLGERIRTQVERSRYQYNKEEIAVTVSVGIVVAQAGVVIDYDQLKFAAAEALKEAKATGRNRCILRVRERSLESGPK